MEIERMIRLPTVNWQEMWGCDDTIKRLNGWLAGRFVDGLAPQSECEYEALVISKYHSEMPEEKFGPWLLRYLNRTFGAISDNPRPRDTDCKQIVGILELV